MYICMYVGRCVCMYVCVYGCMRVYVCVCMYVCVYVCMYLYVCMYISMYVCVCLCIRRNYRSIRYSSFFKCIKIIYLLGV